MIAIQIRHRNDKNGTYDLTHQGMKIVENVNQYLEKRMPNAVEDENHNIAIYHYVTIPTTYENLLIELIDATNEAKESFMKNGDVEKLIVLKRRLKKLLTPNKKVSLKYVAKLLSLYSQQRYITHHNKIYMLVTAPHRISYFKSNKVFTTKDTCAPQRIVEKIRRIAKRNMITAQQICMSELGMTENEAYIFTSLQLSNTIIKVDYKLQL
jgi:hypothetical protein